MPSSSWSPRQVGRLDNKARCLEVHARTLRGEKELGRFSLPRPGCRWLSGSSHADHCVVASQGST
ncbi:unnamed protein product [Discosporangium mesarthrocarpum]